MTHQPAIVEPQDMILSKFATISDQLVELEQFNEKEVFDYEDKAGNKAARSHVSKLRKVKASIERARKEAKADALEYGRKVDEKAKTLSSKLEGMIAVHVGPLTDIKAREERRDANLKTCDLIQTQRHQNSGFLRTLHDKVDSMVDEGYESVKIAKEDALSDILEAIKDAEKREAEAAELERLRREKAEREAEEAEKEAERERQRIADERAKKNAEREIEAAKLREQLAIKQAAEEKRLREEAEERARQQAEHAKQDEADRQERLRLQAIEETKRVSAQAKQDAEQAAKPTPKPEQVMEPDDTLDLSGGNMISVPMDSEPVCHTTIMHNALNAMIDIYKGYEASNNPATLEHPKVVALRKAIDETYEYLENKV